MSTRGRIAIKENGKYTYIYNHCDSYIDGLGIILYKFYKDVNKVKGLISFLFFVRNITGQKSSALFKIEE